MRMHLFIARGSTVATSANDGAGYQATRLIGAVAL